MSASLPGSRELPASQYDLSTYWGRVKQSAGIADPRTLLVSSSGLENAKRLVSSYKKGEIKTMTPEIWQAKKIVDSTLHPARLPPLPHVLLRHLEPHRHRRHADPQHGHNRHPPLADSEPIPLSRDQQRQRQQINPTVHLADDQILSPRRLSLLLRRTRSQRPGAAAQTPQPEYTNHTKPPRALRRRSQRRRLNALVPRLKRLSPSTRTILSRLVPFAAVASAGVLNVFLMRAEEIRQGIDVYRVQKPEQPPPPPNPSTEDPNPNPNPSKQVVVAEAQPQSLGKSRTAALHAVSQTAISRVLSGELST
ncbi:hypothetical protein EPUS_03534 [Endocarpon pusillum Z07020]|uniref:Uncharacterized protein n=1 Tax=Endocarpon pusillum (strain Z07020 / HMAS-L-300199) TaxID=1263415 RepID=U1FYI6_ENDPU|nr:uncharacterized protein EPUS_03534 [Endocarpon pusillum Z07020]ERF69982.1 hypothetical protein EPUS_03534 [Endocarpon pusillum Z07020]